MSTIPTLFRLSKSLAENPALRTKAQKAARTLVSDDFKATLAQIQTNILGRTTLVNGVQTDVFTAEKKRLIQQAVDPANKNNRQLQKEFIELKNEEGLEDFAALTQTKFKKKSAVIKSLPVRGEKHPILKIKVSRTKDQSTGAFVKDALDRGEDFIDAMAYRSPRISPRLATKGKLGLKNYNEGLEALSDHEVDLDRLEANGINVKLLQNKKGKGRIQIPSGKLSYKTSAKEGESITELAGRLKKHATELETAYTRAEDNKRFLSARMMRTNAVTKHINLSGVKTFNEVADQLEVPLSEGRATVLDALYGLSSKGVEVKTMKGKIRITRRDASGVRVFSETKPCPKNISMTTHFENVVAEAFAMEDKPLPELGKRQKVRNAFHPLKKGLLNIFG